MKRQVIVAIITAVFLIVVGTLVASTDAKGQTPRAPSYADREPSYPEYPRSLAGELATPPGFEKGTITAMSKTAIAVDGKNYSLDAGLVLQDELGRAWELKEIVPGLEVMFHRTGKQKAKGRSRPSVDHIVIVLPR